MNEYGSRSSNHPEPHTHNKHSATSSSQKRRFSLSTDRNCAFGCSVWTQAECESYSRCTEIMVIVLKGDCILIQNGISWKTD